MGTSIRFLVQFALFFLFTIARAPAQLHVEGLDLPCITQFVAAAAPARPTAQANAHVVLGWLRLGQQERARDVLTARPAPTNREEAAWLAAATYWYFRASGDLEAIRPVVPAFTRELSLPPPTGGARNAFATEALVVHGMLCCGGLEAALTGSSSAAGGSGIRQRAIEQWLEIERQAWQPGRGHFRPRLTAGQIVPPEVADASLLVPASAGLLLASGDRFARHLRAVTDDALAFPDARGFLDPDNVALLLGAATQLGDHATRRAAWTAVLATSGCEGTLPADRAALRLDATLFAVTGLRLATGIGVDENWLRLRPWLPPRTDRAAMRGLRAEGATFDLELDRRTGGLHPDERDEGALVDLAGSPRIRVRLTIVAAASPATRVVLQGPNVQFVTSLMPGDVVERSLPADPDS